MKRWPVSDTGVPTFAETDTACADGVPEGQSSKRGIKNHPNMLVLVNLLSKGARGAPKQREDTPRDTPSLGTQEPEPQAEPWIYSTAIKPQTQKHVRGGLGHKHREPQNSGFCSGLALRKNPQTPPGFLNGLFMARTYQKHQN